MLYAATTAAHKSNNSYILLIYLVVFGAFYFFYLRPRSKRQKATRQQVRQVEVGDKARTIGGMIGTVVKRTDEAVTLRTEGGHDIEFIPSAIAGKHVPPSAEPEEPGAAEHDEPTTEGDDK